MTVGNKALRVVFALILVGGVAWAALHRDQWDVRIIEEHVRNLGWKAPAAFVILYALATLLFLPGSVFALAGGALFGPVWGTLWNLLGASLGASLAFVVARYLAFDWVARRIGGRLVQMFSGIEAEGWRFVAVVRLVPLFPFNLLNYALGLTRIPFTHYVLASLVCMLPGAVAYTWFGYAGNDVLSGSETAVRDGLLALGVLALVAFLPRLVRRCPAAKATPIDR